MLSKNQFAVFKLYFSPWETYNRFVWIQYVSQTLSYHKVGAEIRWTILNQWAGFGAYLQRSATSICSVVIGKGNSPSNFCAKQTFVSILLSNSIPTSVRKFFGVQCSKMNSFKHWIASRSTVGYFMHRKNCNPQRCSQNIGNHESWLELNDQRSPKGTF